MNEGQILTPNNNSSDVRQYITFHSFISENNQINNFSSRYQWNLSNIREIYKIRDAYRNIKA